jgi:hypothetical protein
MHLKKIATILFILFFSCKNKLTSNVDCTKVKLNDDDFAKISFTSLPKVIKELIIKLATIDKKMDTALSLEKGITYSYYNPGAGQGYVDQVLKEKEIHTINGKCYEFLLYTRPYIIYDEKIFSLEQGLGVNCSNKPCVPDTIGINETTIYVLSLNKILKR